jgi:hypothetical protein
MTSLKVIEWTELQSESMIGIDIFHRTIMMFDTPLVVIQADGKTFVVPAWVGRMQTKIFEIVR